jgi:hypothetical protein
MHKLERNIIQSLLRAAMGAGLALIGLAAVLAAQPTYAQVSPLHPIYPLLDDAGENVLDSGKPVSTLQTCGACHDTEFIQQHSGHANVGWNEMTAPGETTSGRAWDTSSGWFGHWNPITYYYLTPAGDALLDMGTAAWVQLFGARHVGGGPAMYSRDGTLLTELTVTPGDPETNILDAATGQAIPWDWKASGVVEMNCFLCHIQAPNNAARLEALATVNFNGRIRQPCGALGWLPAASRAGSGIRLPLTSWGM